jgi:autotransporter-associated beta strand protein
VNTYSGPTTISAGTLLISGAGRLGGGAYAANITNNGTFNYNSSVAQTLSGAHSGTGALTQSGPGTLTLAGANTYSGNTTISGGTLALGSGVTLLNTPLISIAAGGTVDVSVSGLTLGPGQTLKGNGTVLGNLAMNGTLAPGSSIGVLNANNNVTLGAGSTTIFEISKTPLTNDQLLVTGTLTYGGTLVVTNLAGTLAVGDSFQLFNASGRGGVFAATNLPSLPVGFGWQWSPTSGTLSVVSGVALNPTNLTANLTGNILQLSWPADHTGWRMETNAADITDPNAWFTLDGSMATNQMFIPIDPAGGHVFFRLTYP